MECSTSTCSFRESALHAINEACCAFAEKENMRVISANTGIGKSQLRNKLNPSQTHKLSVDDLLLITKDSGNYCIVNSLLLNLDMVAVKVERNSTDETLVKRALENSMYAGELSRLALENGGEIRLPRRKRTELLMRAHQSVSNLVLLMNDLENKTSGVSPFLSMGLDFIVSGSPLPGLS
ncbi:phage regulatory CII family protein [Psychromonas aquimarina]|uniref:phage regulatory CII family protein n=1 Tax=Psychromonas aquimarina TaxID=444919 RepID=UPI00048B30F7|nr:phage regulatory CII family protein [Psychromonas aquimarina]